MYTATKHTYTTFAWKWNLSKSPLKFPPINYCRLCNHAVDWMFPLYYPISGQLLSQCSLLLPKWWPCNEKNLNLQIKWNRRQRTLLIVEIQILQRHGPHPGLSESDISRCHALEQTKGSPDLLMLWQAISNCAVPLVHQLIQQKPQLLHEKGYWPSCSNTLIEMTLSFHPFYFEGHWWVGSQHIFEELLMK